jgi:hypothetical protein
VTTEHIGPAIEFVGGSFRITASEGPETRCSIPGRLYKIERKNDKGEWHPMSRVQSFKFEVSAYEGAKLTITQHDHNPTA